MTSPQLGCTYKTGKTLGKGSYATVKEATDTSTNERFACKVIAKKLVKGRESMVRNEVAVLKRISKVHPNIVTLHDYFETYHNVYLVLDLCVGGDLFDWVNNQKTRLESDAVFIVNTVFNAIRYIHGCDVVHRDIKPEKILFRWAWPYTTVLLTDFGLSQRVEGDMPSLTDICGTHGYMAPEIYEQNGYGKAVDVWAMGVTASFMLGGGHTVFEQSTQEEEIEAVGAGDYRFEPEEIWTSVSNAGKDFVRYCLNIDPGLRPTAQDVLDHAWLQYAEVGSSDVELTLRYPD